MSNLCQPTALVGAIAIAMGFSTSVSAQDSSNVVNASLETLVVLHHVPKKRLKTYQHVSQLLNRKLLNNLQLPLYPIY